MLHCTCREIYVDLLVDLPNLSALTRLQDVCLHCMEIPVEFSTCTGIKCLNLNSGDECQRDVVSLSQCPNSYVLVSICN